MEDQRIKICGTCVHFDADNNSCRGLIVNLPEFAEQVEFFASCTEWLPTRIKPRRRPGKFQNIFYRLAQAGVKGAAAGKAWAKVFVAVLAPGEFIPQGEEEK